MKRTSLAWGLLVTALGGAVGCGGEDPRPESIDVSGNNTRPTGSSTTNGTDSDSLAPVVTITSPTAVASPATLKDVFTKEVAVTCTAVAASKSEADTVDLTTYVIELLDNDGVSLTAATVTADADGAFHGTLDLTTVPSGAATLRCAASNQATPAVEGEATLSVFVDHGPNVTKIVPAADAVHRPGVVEFSFDATPAELVKGDKGAAVLDAELAIGGYTFPLVRTGDHFVSQVDFRDASKFGDALPTGKQGVQIRATNARGVISLTTLSVVVDGQGPTISVKSPATGAVIGGRVPLTFSVTDAESTVDLSSITVTIDGTLFTYSTAPNSPWTYKSGSVTFEFDTAAVSPLSQSQLTVNITAKDEAGNASERASALYYIDNVPPIVSLDPSPARDVKTTNGVTNCSLAYDPVGTAALNGPPDNKTLITTDSQRFRALVWDLTNGASGQDTLYYSGVKTGSVILYLQPNADAGILVDTNNDRVCDRVDTALQAHVLDPLPPTASAWFTNSEPADTVPLLSDVAAFCPAGLVTTTSPQPKRLFSEYSDLFRIPGRSIGGVATPVLYVIDPAPGAASADAGGRQWQLARLATADGWICLAAEAHDNANNIGISAPIALCYDSPTRPGAPACASNLASPPSCLRGCTYNAPPTPSVLK